ncbi:unnamed protein product [Knipowitschia caucasica]|uniref:Supervillin-like n=1 Tax=Knipowitschia caucasica TaxID=637954 RepID=A0AAV2JIM7_KNICA
MYQNPWIPNYLSHVEVCGQGLGTDPRIKLGNRRLLQKRALSLHRELSQEQKEAVVRSITDIDVGLLTALPKVSELRKRFEGIRSSTSDCDMNRKERIARRMEAIEGGEVSSLVSRRLMEEDTPRYTRSSEDSPRYVRPADESLRYAKTPEDLPHYIKSPEDLPHLSKSSNHLQLYGKTQEGIPHYTKTQEETSDYIKTCEEPRHTQRTDYIHTLSDALHLVKTPEEVSNSFPESSRSSGGSADCPQYSNSSGPCEAGTAATSQQYSRDGSYTSQSTPPTTTSSTTGPDLESKAQRIAQYKAERRRQLAERYGISLDLDTDYSSRYSRPRREISDPSNATPRETSDPSNAMPREISDPSNATPRETSEPCNATPRETSEPSNATPVSPKEARTAPSLDLSAPEPTLTQLDPFSERERLLNLENQRRTAPRGSTEEEPEHTEDTAALILHTRTTSPEHTSAYMEVTLASPKPPHSPGDLFIQQQAHSVLSRQGIRTRERLVRGQCHRRGPGPPVPQHPRCGPALPSDRSSDLPLDLCSSEATYLSMSSVPTEEALLGGKPGHTLGHLRSKAVLQSHQSHQSNPSHPSHQSHHDERTEEPQRGRLMERPRHRPQRPTHELASSYPVSDKALAKDLQDLPLDLPLSVSQLRHSYMERTASTPPSSRRPPTSCVSADINSTEADEEKLDDRAKLSVAAKRSLFRELEKSGEGGSLRARSQNASLQRRLRRGQDRSRTQPVTTEEVVLAATLQAASQRREPLGDGLHMEKVQASEGRPVQAEGQERPARPECQERSVHMQYHSLHQTQPLSQGRPVQTQPQSQQERDQNQERPAHPQNQERPAHPQNQERPAHPQNQERPAHPQNQERPAHPQNQERPAHPQNQERPAHPQNQERPAHPQNQERPAHPQNQERPAHPQNQERPAHPQNQERPAHPQNQERPAHPQNQERPAPPQKQDSLDSQEEPDRSTLSLAEKMALFNRLAQPPTRVTRTRGDARSRRANPRYQTQPITLGDMQQLQSGHCPAQPPSSSQAGDIHMGKRKLSSPEGGARQPAQPQPCGREEVHREEVLMEAVEREELYADRTQERAFGDVLETEVPLQSERDEPRVSMSSRHMSIRERVALLKRSGEDDWRSRNSRKQEVAQVAEGDAQMPEEKRGPNTTVEPL